MVADQMHAATASQDSRATDRSAARRRRATARSTCSTRSAGARARTRGPRSRRWRRARSASTAARSEHLDSVLLLDPTRAGLRDWASDLTFERLLRAERDRRRDLADELAARLIAYDDGRRQTALAADARVELTVAPAGTQVWIERPGAPRQLAGPRAAAALTLPPGAVVLVFEAPGHVTARLPVLLARGETLALRVALPAAESAPPGMIYVPPGRFLFGSADSSDELAAGAQHGAAARGLDRRLLHRPATR